MNQKSTNRIKAISAILICLLGYGCIFISEPDVGSSGDGSYFNPEDDNSQVPNDGPWEQVGGGQAGALGEPEAPDFSSTMDQYLEQPDQNAAIDVADAEAGDALLPIDAVVAQDSSIEEDAEPATSLDAEVPTDAQTSEAQRCGAIEWDCNSTGYCDPIDRPECAITPGEGQCFEFSTVDDTHPEAYSRCCKDLGSCNGGRFCEPVEEAFSYCWLMSASGATCHVAPNPISDYLCR